MCSKEQNSLCLSGRQRKITASHAEAVLSGISWYTLLMMQSISAVTAVLTCMLCSGSQLSFANIASYMHSHYISKPDLDILQASQHLHCCCICIHRLSNAQPTQRQRFMTWIAVLNVPNLLSQSYRHSALEPSPPRFLYLHSLLYKLCI